MDIICRNGKKARVDEDVAAFVARLHLVGYPLPEVSTRGGRLHFRDARTTIVVLVQLKQVDVMYFTREDRNLFDSRFYNTLDKAWEGICAWL